MVRDQTRNGSCTRNVTTYCKKTVKYKIIILTLFVTLGLTTSWGQTEIVVKFSKSEKVIRAKDFRFSIQNQTDTTFVFTSTADKEFRKKTILTSIHSDTISGLFEFSNDNKTWNSIEYSFIVDTNNLKRVEINLYFGVNDKKTEFLQDFTVDHFYKTDVVSIQGGRLKVGSQPVFMLTSKSDTTFWGASPTNHFYGTIKSKTEFGWYDFSGSYCMSTVPEKALTKGDTVYSWIPNYSPGDEYKIKRSGTYKYVVPMGLEKFSNGTPTIFITNGQTRKRTRIFYEVETEFTIE